MIYSFYGKFKFHLWAFFTKIHGKIFVLYSSKVRHFDQYLFLGKKANQK